MAKCINRAKAAHVLATMLIPCHIIMSHGSAQHASITKIIVQETPISSHHTILLKHVFNLYKLYTKFNDIFRRTLDKKFLKSIFKIINIKCSVAATETNIRLFKNNTRIINFLNIVIEPFNGLNRNVCFKATYSYIKFLPNNIEATIDDIKYIHIEHQVSVEELEQKSINLPSQEFEAYLFSILNIIENKAELALSEQYLEKLKYADANYLL